MTDEQKQAFNAVEKINEELYKKYSKKNPNNFDYDSLDKMPVVSVCFSGVYIIISVFVPSTNKCDFPEFILYHSEWDDRIYYEESNTYETFYKFIKRKFRIIKKELNTIKI